MGVGPAYPMIRRTIHGNRDSRPDHPADPGVDCPVVTKKTGTMNPASRFARAGHAAAIVGLPILVVFVLFTPRLDGDLSRPVYAAAHGGKSKKAPKDFDYTVSDCQGSDQKDSVGLEVSEDSVRFHQILTMNCIAATHPSTVNVSYAKQKRDLQVGITLSSPVLSDCTCPIAIDGVILRLGKGTYRIAFTFVQAAGSEKATRQALGSKEFSIE
jgi:hypothetical protein